MKYKKRMDRIMKILGGMTEEKVSLNEAIEELRPIISRYANSARNDRQNGNIQRWEKQSFAFIAAAYSTYLADNEEIPQFVIDLLELRRMAGIEAGENDRKFYVSLWVAMKIVVPEIFDLLKGEEGGENV